MATISTRQRKDGSLAYLGEVRVKRDGKIVHRESRTFDRLGQTKAWAESRDKKFTKQRPATKHAPRLSQATLRKLLEKYREDVSEVRPMGRSKTSNIRFLEKCEIARITACEIISYTSWHLDRKWRPLADSQIATIAAHCFRLEL